MVWKFREEISAHNAPVQTAKLLAKFLSHKEPAAES